jgi:hypothetical protein
VDGSAAKLVRQAGQLTASHADDGWAVMAVRDPTAMVTLLCRHVLPAILETAGRVTTPAASSSRCRGASTCGGGVERTVRGAAGGTAIRGHVTAAERPGKV